MTECFSSVIAVSVTHIDEKELHREPATGLRQGKHLPIELINAIDLPPDRRVNT